MLNPPFKPESDYGSADHARLYEFQKRIDLLHAVLGLAGEAGEVIDPVKKAFFYGKDLDEKALANLREEAGDLLWYIAGPLCRALGVSLEDIAKINIEKLQKRYPEKYTDDAAAVRADKDGVEAHLSAIDLSKASTPSAGIAWPEALISDLRFQVKMAKGEVCEVIAEIYKAAAQRDEAVASLTAEKNLHSQTRAVVEDLNTLCTSIRERESTNTKRLKWLHTGSEKDAEGYEWGVFRVKWDANGQVLSVWQTNSDMSDLDAEMARTAAEAPVGEGVTWPDVNPARGYCTISGKGVSWEIPTHSASAEIKLPQTCPCTFDPNTCRSGLCNWPRCYTERDRSTATPAVENATLRALLSKCFTHLGEEMERKTLSVSAADGTQALMHEVAEVLDVSPR